MKMHTWSSTDMVCRHYHQYHHKDIEDSNKQQKLG